MVQPERLDQRHLAILTAALPALRAGRVALDSTSGNMGIAYATLGRALGVAVKLAIPANATSAPSVSRPCARSASILC